MSAGESGRQEPLESALKNLKPSAPNFDRDRLMFRAGQSSAHRRRWPNTVLPALIGILAGSAITFATVRATWQPETRVVVVKVPVPADVPQKQAVKEPDPLVVPSPTPALAPAAPGSVPWELFASVARPATGYLQLRDQVLRWGVEAMPSVAPTAGVKHSGEPNSVWHMQSNLYGSTDGL